MPELNLQRPTWAEINLDNLAFNLRSVKDFIGSGVKYMAVVKADAYGHGAATCATRFESEGIDWLGVALPEEGVELRQAGITKPILCLGGFWPGQEALVLEHKLTPVIYQMENARILDHAARERNEIAGAVHIKVDTGAGRIGVRFDNVVEFAESLAECKNLKIEGVMTHFAAADDLGQNEFTALQIKRFDESVEIFRSKGFNPVFLDLANSPGAVAHPESRGNMVRLGGVLYGLGGDVLPKAIETPALKPVLSLYTRIAQIKRVPKGESIGYGRTFITQRDSLIATIPIGYHDGYSRSLSNRGRTIINGGYAPVVGRISMDWTILDVTDSVDPKVGDLVTLIGRQDGLAITAEEIAELLDTISYEVTCDISWRVPRRFSQNHLR